METTFESLTEYLARTKKVTVCGLLLVDRFSGETMFEDDEEDDEEEPIIWAW